MSELQPRTLRIGFVPGVTPGKWLDRWRDRHPEVPLEAGLHDGVGLVSLLRNGSVDIAFVRLPVDRSGLSVIPLYEEAAVVVASKDHELSLFDEVPLAELQEENLLDIAECGGYQKAVEVAATGAGVVVLPMAVARHYQRKDAVFRVVPDAPSTGIAVAWLAEDTTGITTGSTTEDLEEFIGIVRGRTERSSRQPSARAEPERKKPVAKAAAKRAAAGGRKPADPRKGTGSGRKPGQPGRGRRR